jgi:predicted nucleic acid-binding protein
MKGKCFVDTNILVYAHDRDAGAKFNRAHALTRDLWLSERGVISTQVLQELYMALRRKASNPLPVAEAEKILRDFFTWEVVINDRSSIIRALEIETRYQISFWDALIVQAAERSDAEVLYSEDLSNGQRYGGVQVLNPFKGQLRS